MGFNSGFKGLKYVEKSVVLYSYVSYLGFHPVISFSRQSS